MAVSAKGGEKSAHWGDKNEAMTLRGLPYACM